MPRPDRARARRLGRKAEAALAYQAAIDRTHNAAEREFLARSRARLAGSAGSG